MEPLVSVLMTSYNREKYIADAIGSVLASTYTNFELVICDDRSSDSTVAIARSFAEKDQRIKVYINETNLGDYPNRNKAASLATGKYLKYLDSDDLIYPYSLKVMVDAMEAHPMASFAFCGNEVQDYSQPYPVLYSGEEAFRINYFGVGGLFYAGPGGTIIRRSSFESVGGFSGRRFIGDTELWMKFALAGPVLKIQPGLIWWRTHPGQEFAIGGNEYALLRYDLNKDMLTHPLCPLTPQEKARALGNGKRLMGRKILGALRKFDFSAAAGLARKSGLGPLTIAGSLIPVNKIRRLSATFGTAKS